MPAYPERMPRVLTRVGRATAALPAVVFAGAFLTLGWLASHSLTYAIVAFVPVNEAEAHVHHYITGAYVTASVLMMIAFMAAMCAVLRSGRRSAWLSRGGWYGSASQQMLAMGLPAASYVAIEYL